LIQADAQPSTHSPDPSHQQQPAEPHPGELAVAYARALEVHLFGPRVASDEVFADVQARFGMASPILPVECSAEMSRLASAAVAAALGPRLAPSEPPPQPLRAAAPNAPEYHYKTDTPPVAGMENVLDPPDNVAPIADAPRPVERAAARDAGGGGGGGGAVRKSGRTRKPVDRFGF